MSTFAQRPSESPVVGYVILHQSRSGLLAPEYAATMEVLHKQINERAKEFALEREQLLRESIGHEVQLLFGSLSEFLETPIQTDRDAIRRLIQETLQRISVQAGEDAAKNLRHSLETRVKLELAKAGSVRVLQTAGKTYLQHLGFDVGGTNEVYESWFVVTGGAGLDLLEEIIRDKIGIHKSAHGDHVAAAAAQVFQVFNLIGLVGLTGKPAQGCEAALVFDKPSGVPYERLFGVLEPIAAQISESVAGISFWQRKLGLGKGKEFLLKVWGETEHAAINGCTKAHESLRSILGENSGTAGLVVKEVLY